MTTLRWLWLFPLPIFAVLNTRRHVMTWMGTPVVEWRWWLKGYATAAGTRILVPPGRARLVPSRLLRHEAKHLEQQRRWGGVLFLLIYGADFLVQWVRHGFRWHPAYLAIGFEREARAAERSE